MTMLESGPADLPWSQNGYLLFHAIRTGNLLPRLYQWKPGITCKPLFLDTRFHQLLDISPVLVPLSGPDDPVLLPFLENAINLWGLLLFSDADLDSVTGHLRWLITVAEPVGKPTLLSLWDPPVANALFGLYPEHTGNTLFGPIEHVYALDHFHECWRHHQRGVEAPVIDRTKLYCLNEAQIDALDEVSFTNLVIKLEQHMRTHFPDFRGQASRSGRLTYFHRMASVAYENGLHSAIDIFHFANVFRFLDSQAPDAHLDIAEMLYRRSTLTPSQRAQQANLMVRQRARELAGAHHD